MQTFTSLEYLKIDVASSYGLDKEDWTARITWFDQNEAALRNIAALDERALRLNSMMKEADSPALFYAGIQAFVKASRGEPISHPISLDATASGAQILALLIGCEKSARLCNVINTGKREDLYTNIFQGMLTRLDPSQAGRIMRGDAKQAVMTSLYGSQAQPKRVFGEGEQLMAFYQTMEQDAPGIWELNMALLNLWNPEALSHDWVLPDNFHVHVKVMDTEDEHTHFFNSPVTITSKVNRPTETGRSIPANGTHSVDALVVRELLRRCNYDDAKMSKLLRTLQSGASWRGEGDLENDNLVMTLWQHYLDSGFLSARILELLDGSNLHLVDRDVIKAMMDTLPDVPFEVLTVHDCFRCHPNYGNELRRQYNQILSEIGRSDMLSYLASQITGQKLNVSKYGDVSAQVLQADYALS